MNETYYKSEDWLNGFESPSTGSIVCYDGWRDYSDGDTIEDFIAKAKKMRNALTYFINHLKKHKEI